MALDAKPHRKVALESFLPSNVWRQRILKRVRGQLDTLVVHNVENICWSLYQSVNDTFRRFASTLDSRLADTVAACASCKSHPGSN